MQTGKNQGLFGKGLTSEKIIVTLFNQINPLLY